jgi:hypothetical protein
MGRVRACWLLVVFGVAGCLSSGQPVPCPEPLATALDIPAGCRNRVYFFLVGDFHPCHDLESLRGQLIDAGYIKVYCGKPWHLSHFTQELKKVHEAEPEARFVIVGQGGAAPAARELAGHAGQAGIGVDLFVYLDDVKEPAPVPAMQVIAIHGDKDDAGAAGAEVEYTLTDAGHKGAAGHPQTLKLLLHYLEPVAARVPLVEEGPSTGPRAGPHDDWDFLEPDGRDTGDCAYLPFQLAPGAPPAAAPERSWRLWPW